MDASEELLVNDALKAWLFERRHALRQDMRNLARDLARALGGLSFSKHHHDGFWAVTLDAELNVRYEGYAKQTLGPRGRLEQLLPWELVELIESAHLRSSPASSAMSNPAPKDQAQLLEEINPDGADIGSTVEVLYQGQRCVIDLLNAAVSPHSRSAADVRKAPGKYFLGKNAGYSFTESLFGMPVGEIKIISVY